MNRKNILERKLKLREYKSSQKAIDFAKLPAKISELRELFDFVNTQVEARGCDRTFTHTLFFIQSRKLDEKPIVDWLMENGGYCDCEMLANVEEKVEELVENSFNIAE